MLKKWIVFYNRLTGESLTKITVEGFFTGEMMATKELLAYENNLSVEDIDAILEE